MERNNWDKSFWKGAFSEPDGTGSASRILSAIVVVFGLSWITITIVHNILALKSAAMTIPELGTVSAFVSAVVGVLYGTNKVFSKLSDTVSNITVNKKDQ
jgi:hypothetical protein